MPNVPRMKTGPLTFLLPIVCFAACLQKVNCDGIARVKLISFNNPGGQLSNGDCCDKIPLLGTCEADGGCDPYFVVCIDQTSSTALDNLTACTVGSATATQMTMDQSSITFGPFIGSGFVSGLPTPNPLTFSFTSWPSKVLVKVQVWDDNLLQTRSKIDFMMSSPPLSISAAADATVANKWTNVTVQNRTTMTMQLQVFCGPTWYGAQCNVQCIPSLTNQYTCGSNGVKRCTSDWAGPNCDQLSITDGSYRSAPVYTGLVSLCAMIVSLFHYLDRTAWPSAVAV